MAKENYLMGSMRGTNLSLSKSGNTTYERLCVHFRVANASNMVTFWLVWLVLFLFCCARAQEGLSNKDHIWYFWVYILDAFAVGNFRNLLCTLAQVGTGGILTWTLGMGSSSAWMHSWLDLAGVQIELIRPALVEAKIVPRFLGWVGEVSKETRMAVS